MKKIFLLAIILVVISCKYESQSEANFVSYHKGGEAFAEIDNDGNNNYSKALELFKKSIEEHPNHIESYQMKMLCEFHLGQLDNALETSIKVISNKKNHKHHYIADFYITAGIVEKINGENEKSLEYLQEALNVFEKRIRRNKKDIYAIINKPLVLCYMNKKDDAIEFLNSQSVDEQHQSILESAQEELLIFDTDEFIKNLGNKKF